MDKKRAFQEQKSSSTPSHINAASIEKIRGNRRKNPSAEELFQQIIKGDQAALSRGITLIESLQENHITQAEELIERCLPYANKSLRIGITGVPGVGKSTFIEAFGLGLAEAGKKIAVLAIDPSSSVSGGSIMGDKTRMEKLVNHKNAFIRPSSSGDSLGGVARKTRESIILCEAAGFDLLLIETVGVGQSSTSVHSMTDFFLLLKLAGAGDELQGIKRGIIEMADAIVINKADGENYKAAKRAKTEFNRALHLFPAKDNEWVPKVLLCSSLKNEGISEIWNLITEFEQKVKKNGYFEEKRFGQNKFWLLQTIEEHLKSRFYNNPKIKTELSNQLKKIEEQKTTPFAAAKFLLEMK